MDDVLVVVPARGGSKRICNKNIKNIGGWPMISWPLRQLSTLFKSGRVVVSTDSQKIVDLVKKYNLDVPFIRPEELSGDYVGTMPVVSHALSWYERYVQKVKYILIVYPTAVILDYTNILKAYEIITNNSLCGCVFSAAHFAAPIQRAFYEKNGFASMISPEYLSVRSQDLEEFFYLQ